MTDAKAKIIAALIAALAAVIVAVINLYGTVISLQKENTALQEQKTELQEQNDVLQAESENSSEVQSTISTLEKRISELEAANSTARESYSALREDYSTLQGNYEAALAEIEELKNGLSPNVELSSNVPEESTSNEGENFIEVLRPYESARYETPNTMTMMGNSYSNGFLLNAGYSGYALFNLDGKYSTLRFDFGHIDGSTMGAVSYSIYLDGKFLQSVDGTPEMRVTSVSIPLNGALQMKIEFGQHGGYPAYGFANAIIS